jgi:membrane-associated phospholipid phosphatase
MEPERGIPTRGHPDAGGKGSRIPWWTGIWIGGATGFGVLIALAKVWDSITEQGLVVRFDQRWLSTLTTHRTSWVTKTLRGISWFGDMRVISGIVVLTAVSGQLVATAGSAFPSGHATQGAACYGALAWIVARQLARRWKRILIFSGTIVLAGLVGLSRVYLGVHWPSDVGSGWALGMGWLVVCMSVLVAMRRLLKGPWTLPSAADARSP